MAVAFAFWRDVHMTTKPPHLLRMRCGESIHPHTCLCCSCASLQHDGGGITWEQTGWAVDLALNSLQRYILHYVIENPLNNDFAQVCYLTDLHLVKTAAKPAAFCTVTSIAYALTRIDILTDKK